MTVAENGNQQLRWLDGLNDTLESLTGRASLAAGGRSIARTDSALATASRVAKQSAILQVLLLLVEEVSIGCCVVGGVTPD